MSKETIIPPSKYKIRPGNFIYIEYPYDNILRTIVNFGGPNVGDLHLEDVCRDDGYGVIIIKLPLRKCGQHTNAFITVTVQASFLNITRNAKITKITQFK